MARMERGSQEKGREKTRHYDTFSSAPRDVLSEALDKVGYRGSRIVWSIRRSRRGIHGTPHAEEVRSRILEDVTGRLRQNVAALPEPLQERVEEVAAGVAAFAFKGNWLGGEAGFLSLTASTSTPYAISLARARECAALMREAGLIEVSQRKTRGGHAYELWSLSKKIEPALAKVRW